MTDPTSHNYCTWRSRFAPQLGERRPGLVVGGLQGSNRQARGRIAGELGDLLLDQYVTAKTERDGRERLGEQE